MEFIVDNLVWFIVGGVVVLMTIIGYFAEKTNFAKEKNKEEDPTLKVEKMKKTNNKEEKKAKIVEETKEVNEQIPVDANISQATPSDEFVIKADTNTEQEVNENINVNIEENNSPNVQKVIVLDPVTEENNFSNAQEVVVLDPVTEENFPLGNEVINQASEVVNNEQVVENQNISNNVVNSLPTENIDVNIMEPVQDMPIIIKDEKVNNQDTDSSFNNTINSNVTIDNNIEQGIPPITPSPQDFETKIEVGSPLDEDDIWKF